jgi:hypothetical protein
MKPPVYISITDSYYQDTHIITRDDAANWLRANKKLITISQDGRGNRVYLHADECVTIERN